MVGVSRVLANVNQASHRFFKGLANLLHMWHSLTAPLRLATVFIVACDQRFAGAKCCLFGESGVHKERFIDNARLLRARRRLRGETGDHHGGLVFDQGLAVFSRLLNLRHGHVVVGEGGAASRLLT